jgi:CRISPR-associated protein Csm4
MKILKINKNIMPYQIYELKLKPQSPWISDLTADTIFGHLCWQIKYEF